MRIGIAEAVGKVAAGHSVALPLRRAVERAVRDGDEQVVLDFTGVQAASPSFADELIAKLDPELLARGRVTIVGANEANAKLIDLVCRRRTPV